MTALLHYRKESLDIVQPVPNILPIFEALDAKCGRLYRVQGGSSFFLRGWAEHADLAVARRWQLRWTETRDEKGNSRMSGHANCRADVVGPAVESGTWWLALTRPVRRWLARIRRQRRIRRDNSKLMELDDRMLADIGLSRADAQFTARHGRLPERLRL